MLVMGVLRSICSMYNHCNSNTTNNSNSITSNYVNSCVIIILLL